MLGLKVSINGEKPVVCGADDLGVLTVYVSLAGQLGERAVHPRPGEPPDLWVSAKGMTSRADAKADEHVTWLSLEPLRVGDTVTIAVVQTDEPSPPVSRKPARDRGERERKRRE